MDGIEDVENIRYHVNNCYARYASSKRRADKRTSILQECSSVPENAGEPSEPPPSTTRPKRRKSKDEENILLSEPRNRPCCVCNCIKSKGDKKRYRICERRWASRFLATIKFNKDVTYTRYSYMETVGDVFAADVMYHVNCLTKYLRSFERAVEDILNPSLNELNSDNNLVLVGNWIQRLLFIWLSERISKVSENLELIR